MIQTWANILATTVDRVWVQVASAMPSIVVAIVLLILGWVVGAGLGRIIKDVIGTLKIDAALRSAGFDAVVTRAGHTLDTGAFLGGLVKWFVIAIFFVMALEVLQFQQVTSFLGQIVFVYLPQVIVAVLILLIAAVLADFVQKAVVASAKAAEIGSPYFVGSVARWSIWIFAILTALDQLSVATAFVQTLFTGIVIAISLALGLSFGLGGQQAASRYIERVSNELSKKHNGTNTPNNNRPTGMM